MTEFQAARPLSVDARSLAARVPLTDSLTLVAYTATVLASAVLLFLLEPMFARMVLPLLGGAPAVWNTALVFYQVVLLLGYGYVHWATTRLDVKRQVGLHVVLLAVAAASLPIVVPPGWQPPPSANPIPSLLAILALAVGLPFLVVSTTGPLMQKWFAGTGHRLAPDPYFLYAASNLGSMIGLLGYPLIVEPRLRLLDQTRLWSWGYGTLAALLLLCAGIALRAAQTAAPRTAASVTARLTPLPWMRRLRWALLAFAPSSLMMGVTAHITTDVAAVPLLWVAPLALYLLSFTLVFARRTFLPHVFWVRLLPLSVLPLAVLMVGRAGDPLLMILGVHLLVMFVVAMVCHGELAADRPESGHLTEFYLWLGLGGALGGIFNALVAPLIFTSVLEYPLMIVFACMLAPARKPGPSRLRDRLLDIALPLAVGGAMVGTLSLARGDDSEPTRALAVITAAFLTLPLFSFSGRPVRFALGVGALLFASSWMAQRDTRNLHHERSFFGTHRVFADTKHGLHCLIHGTTIHGVQRNAPGAACREPLGYYGKNGPLPEVFESLRSRGRLGEVAVLGLGSGGTAAYAMAGERWSFFEIDPAVARIAQDPSLFCFLSTTPATNEIVLGDARLTLASSPRRFDMVLLDAYSSDAIPVHLLTREALQVYRSHLTERGVMVFHLSNRYFRLTPVVARLATDAGLLCWIKSSGPVAEADVERGVFPSLYAVVAARPEDVGPIATSDRWKRVTGAGAPLWTDDFSSLFSVLERRSR